MKQWLAFFALSLMWGSSFLWIKIAIDDIQPMMVVLIRLIIGLAGTLIIAALMRATRATNKRDWFHMGVMGVVGVAMPFTLITIAEQYIASSLAAMLNATVPLFTMIIAAFVLADERITAQRLIGLLVGFAGVLLLLSKDLDPNDLLNSNVFGQLLMIAATLCYAIGSVYTRRNLRHLPAMTQNVGVLVGSVVVMVIATPLLERPLVLPELPITWVAVAWLGLLGTAGAYACFFYLLQEWGPTRAVLVTYVVPVVGLILGVALLNEPLSWQLLVGGGLIIAGIVVVNWASVRQLLRSRRQPAASD